MKQLVGTSAKTWHSWQVERGDHLGIPQLVMGFTEDGQANPQMVADRDKGYRISLEEEKKARAEIAAPPIQPESTPGRRARSSNASQDDRAGDATVGNRLRSTHGARPNSPILK
jgi:Protein of unknown function (DUF1264)